MGEHGEPVTPCSSEGKRCDALAAQPKPAPHLQYMGRSRTPFKHGPAECARRVHHSAPSERAAWLQHMVQPRTPIEHGAAQRAHCVHLSAPSERATRLQHMVWRRTPIEHMPAQRTRRVHHHTLSERAACLQHVGGRRASREQRKAGRTGRAPLDASPGITPRILNMGLQLPAHPHCARAGEGSHQRPSRSKLAACFHLLGIRCTPYWSG